ncbi:MAG: CRISPR-associated endonuclease Cas1 [Oxalobacteraceae bacterium]|nr:CRISPR-associated endonuclease Cas1 [Oxalobacteraceae bacterium]
MTTLYIDKKGLDLDMQGMALILRENGKKTGSIPLGPVQRIFLRGEVTLPARLLAKLGDLGIGLVLLAGWKSKPTLFLPRAHHDAQRRLQQYHHYHHQDYRLTEARIVLLAKLEAQITLLNTSLEHVPKARYPITHALQHLAALRPNLEQLSNLPSMRGWEGGAAEIYYRGLATLLPDWAGFNGRNRRPPRDPANAMMSLTYTLLHAEAVLAAYGAGLDPDIGMLHDTSFARESLACDLIEALRPAADGWIARLMRDGTFTADDFISNEQGCLLGKAGRMRFYAAWEEAMPAWRRQLQEQCGQMLSRMEQRPCAA